MTVVRRLSVPLAAFLLLFALGACSDQSKDALAGCEPELPAEAGKSHVTLDVGGADREFLLVVPSGYDGSQPHALMLAFHGAGPPADDRPRSELEFDEIWDEASSPLPADMVVAAPQAAAGGWDGAGSGSADVGFAEQILDHVEQQLCIDPGRVYATGNSSGGMLVSHLVCDLADRLIAVGTNIGVADPFPLCDGQPSPIPVVSIVGSEDRVPVGFVADVHGRWAQNNGCEPEPRTDRSTTGVTTTEYGGCSGGATVAFHVVEGMGHQQARSSCSNIPPPVRDAVCFESDFDFRRAHLEFFASHTRS